MWVAIIVTAVVVILVTLLALIWLIRAKQPKPSATQTAAVNKKHNNRHHRPLGFLVGTERNNQSKRTLRQDEELGNNGDSCGDGVSSLGGEDEAGGGSMESSLEQSSYSTIDYDYPKVAKPSKSKQQQNRKRGKYNKNGEEQEGHKSQGGSIGSSVGGTHGDNHTREEDMDQPPRQSHELPTNPDVTDYVSPYNHRATALGFQSLPPSEDVVKSLTSTISRDRNTPRTSAQFNNKRKQQKQAQHASLNTDDNMDDYYIQEHHTFVVQIPAHQKLGMVITSADTTTTMHPSPSIDSTHDRPNSLVVSSSSPQGRRSQWSVFARRPTKPHHSVQAASPTALISSSTDPLVFSSHAENGRNTPHNRKRLRSSTKPTVSQSASPSLLWLQQFPVVHALKESSLLRSQGVQVGDFLIQINQQSVKHMTATQVSKYIQQYQQKHQAASLYHHHRTDSNDTAATLASSTASEPDDLAVPVSLPANQDSRINSTVTDKEENKWCCTLTLLRPREPGSSSNSTQQKGTRPRQTTTSNSINHTARNSTQDEKDCNCKDNHEALTISKDESTAQDNQIKDALVTDNNDMLLAISKESPEPGLTLPAEPPTADLTAPSEEATPKSRTPPSLSTVQKPETAIHHNDGQSNNEQSSDNQ